MGNIVLSHKLYGDYMIDDNCFGSSEEDMCYDLTESQCKKCKDKKLCGEIFNAKEGTKILDASQADAAEVLDNKPEETTEEPVIVDTDFVYTRPVLTKSLVMLGKRFDVEYDVKKLQRITKLFDKDEQVFKISDKTLRINGITDGDVLGLKDADWEEKEKSIVVDITNTQAIKKVISNYFKQAEVKTEEFKEELDLDTSGDSVVEESTDEELDIIDAIVANAEIDKVTSVLSHNLIGGVSVNVYADNTVEISTTVSRDRISVDEIIGEMKKLLDSF